MKFSKTGPYFSAKFLTFKSRRVPYPCLTSARTLSQNMKSRRILANQGEVVSLTLTEEVSIPAINISLPYYAQAVIYNKLDYY